MAQHKQLTWTELRVGLFVLAATALLVVVIFYVTGPSALGPKYRLHAFLPEVDGLTVGAPVRLDGVEVGNVEKRVALQPNVYEGGLHAWQNARHAPFVDGAGQCVFVFSFEIYF